LIENDFKKLNGKLWGDDKIEDNNGLEYKVQLHYFINLFRMFYLVAWLVVLVGAIWLILVK